MEDLWIPKQEDSPPDEKKEIRTRLEGKIRESILRAEKAVQEKATKEIELFPPLAPESLNIELRAIDFFDSTASELSQYEKYKAWEDGDFQVLHQFIRTYYDAVSEKDKVRKKKIIRDVLDDINDIHYGLPYPIRTRASDVARELARIGVFVAPENKVFLERWPEEKLKKLRGKADQYYFIYGRNTSVSATTDKQYEDLNDILGFMLKENNKIDNISYELISPEGTISMTETGWNWNLGEKTIKIENEKTPELRVEGPKPAEHTGTVGVCGPSSLPQPWNLDWKDIAESSKVSMNKAKANITPYEETEATVRAMFDKDGNMIDHYAKAWDDSDYWHGVVENHQEASYMPLTAKEKFLIEINKVAYRVAADQINRVSKGILIAAVPKDSEGIQAFLDSELGTSFVSVLSGMALAYGMKNNEKAQKLGREFRVSGLASAGNFAIEEILAVVSDAVMNAVKEEAPVVSLEEELLVDDEIIAPEMNKNDHLP